MMPAWPDWTEAEWRAKAGTSKPKHLGGPGSGNFGHAGRPGEVGGSASGSGGGSGETRAAVRTASPQFKTWFKDSQVVDEDGDPLRVYHGTTHDIAAFKAAGAEGLNPESDWGAGVYFTSDPDDASENYAGEGPDLTSRLESRAETLIADAESQDEELDHDTAMGRARAELAGKSPSVIPAYLSMQKPVVLGAPNGSSSADETHFTMEYEYDDPDDPDSDIVGEKGSLPAFLSTLREVVQERGDGSTDAADYLAEFLSGEDYVSASRLAKIWKGSEVHIEHPETGQIINSEVFREALQRAGYDGVIDRTVDAKFGSGRKYGQKMKGVNPDTTHFIVFEPTQAKSAIGNKRFDPTNPAITMGTKRSGSGIMDLGGAGSGNFGHAGRPGEVGGSAPGEAGASAAQSDAGARGGGRAAAATAATGHGRPAAIAAAHHVANTYNETKGLPPVRHDDYVTVDEPRAGDIADAYDDLPVDDSDNPAVREAYTALREEIGAQWDHITGTGMRFIPWTKEGQPYATSSEMAADIRDHKRMYFFTGGERHPLLGTIDPKSGLSDNDKFRAVHDYFGHAAGGYGFGARGEENAWVSHSQMLTPAARRALTTETRGQNSWVNFGKQNYHPDGRPKHIPPGDRPFATQKVALLPDQYVLLPGETTVGERSLYRDRLAFLLGGAGSGEHEGHPFRGNQWTSGAAGAAVLKGVDPKANAARETARLLEHWVGLTGARPTPEALKAAEAELRALPLVHGTTVAGAIGAMEEGLISHAAMQADVADLKADRDEMWKEIKQVTGATGTDELAYIQAEDFEDSGLSYDKATEVVAKIREFLDVDRVLGGTTNAADVKLGLDQFVFMTHGQKHQDYGTVAVVIDNSVVDAPDSFATEHDIIVVAPLVNPKVTGPKAAYAPTGIQKYQDTIVKGDGYYQTAAAKAGSETAMQSRSRDQLFEVKAAAVPKDKVLGFVVTDYDEAVRLSEKLANKGITGKVLHVEDYGNDAFLRNQLKAIQSTGGWDEEAATEASDNGKTAYILSGLS